MRKIRVGVLGSTGLVGQQFVRMLEAHPYFELSVLTSSNQSAGKKYSEAVEWLIGGEIPRYVQEKKVYKTVLEEILDKDIDIVFSALPAVKAKEIEVSLAKEGIFVFTNASANRMKPDVPILIPEVNPEHLKIVKWKIKPKKGSIIANSNCSTTGLVIGLKPLIEFGLRNVIVTTFQSLSGAGRLGVASMDILGNVIPYIKNEEEKIERETVKIFGRLDGKSLVDADFEVHATCCRVPVRDGHLESVSVELERDVDLDIIHDRFCSFKGLPQKLNLPTAPEAPVIVRREVSRPQPILDAEAGSPSRALGMTVTIGRIRKKGRRICFLLLVHNTIRGAAGTCILNAELALAKDLIMQG